MSAPNLIYIRPSTASTSVGDSDPAQLRGSVLKALNAPSGQKTLPTTLLYDERGLELYDELTTNAGEHYYLFPAEEHILKNYSPDVIRAVCGQQRALPLADDDGRRGVLLELGCGSVRKTAHLISALSEYGNSLESSASPSASQSRHRPTAVSGGSSPKDAKEPAYTYYALDLAPISLTQSLESLTPIVNDHVALKGLVTDYDSGLDWIRNGGLDSTHAKASGLQQPTPGDVTPANEPNDLTRGRSARRPAASSDTQQPTPGPSNVPLKNIAPTPSALPEEGWRIPIPLHPETPPHSKSRDPSQDARDSFSPYSTPYTAVHDIDDPVEGLTAIASSHSVSPSLAADSQPASSLPVDQDRQYRGSDEWEHGSPPLHLLFLGSSLGNFDRTGAAAFLSKLPLRPGSSDTLLLGLDGRNEKALVERAYNDPEGYTARFILNGLDVAADSLGVDPFTDRFEYHGTFNEEIGRHEAYYRSKEAFSLPVDGSEPLTFEKGELINIEYSYKYSDADAHALFDEANLRPIKRWQDPKSLYSLWLLERPAFSFPRVIHPNVQDTVIEDLQRAEPSVQTAAGLNTAWKTQARGGSFGAPSFAEYQEMWKLWDEITLGMIPREMLLEKPIDLRHICLFYLGHIPAFLDIHLSRLLSEPHSEPEVFKDIFERGIDPSVDDPTKIHPHSIVPERPEDWPSLDSILDFRDRVRSRVARLYQAIERKEERVMKLGRKVDRVLWMCYEHEGWHAETLLYMLIQRAGTPGGTIAPRGFAPPSLENVHHLILPDKSSLTRPPPHALIQLHPGTFSIGHDDPEKLDLKTASLFEAETYEFGWDLEHPKREVTIPKQVLVEKLCITNAEYLVYFRLFQESKGLRMPDNWVPSEPSTTTDSVEFQVRSLYGPVPFAAAAQWPFVGSYDEIEAFAAWKGGRIPTEIELRAFMDRHLGAESSLIGFKKWTFVPGLAPDPESNLRGHNGGVWEWSSSILDSHDGYEPSILYPGFSSDFFDNDHHVVLGGSFATIPRLAQRRTVRNFYQHNYRFAWIAGRVAYDV